MWSPTRRGRAKLLLRRTATIHTVDGIIRGAEIVGPISVSRSDPSRTEHTLWLQVRRRQRFDRGRSADPRSPFRSSPANYQPRVPSSCQIRPIDARCGVAIRLRFSQSVAAGGLSDGSVAYMTPRRRAAPSSASHRRRDGRLSGVRPVILEIARSKFRLLRKT